MQNVSDLIFAAGMALPSPSTQSPFSMICSFDFRFP